MPDPRVGRYPPLAPLLVVITIDETTKRAGSLLSLYCYLAAVRDT